MTGRWPTGPLFGLHVDLGFYHADSDKWLRLPVATFRCVRGCHEVAVGLAEVTALTARIRVPDHARTCPSRPTTTKENRRA